MYSIQSRFSVQNDGRVLASLASIDRPAWISPTQVRHWVSEDPDADRGTGAYGFIPHLSIDGECFGGVALTSPSRAAPKREGGVVSVVDGQTRIGSALLMHRPSSCAGAVASMDEEDDSTGGSTTTSVLATPGGSTTASVLPTPGGNTTTSVPAKPVGSKTMGLVDSNIAFARPLLDGAALVAGRRMQHIRAEIDGTHTVCAFHNFSSSVSAMASRRDGATVVGTGGGGVLLWAHGSELVSAALPEPFPGRERPAIYDPGLGELQETVRKGGVRGIAPLTSGRICVGAFEHVVFWDPRDSRIETVDVKEGVAKVACATDGLHIAILNATEKVNVWDSRMHKNIPNLSTPNLEKPILKSDALGNALLCCKYGAFMGRVDGWHAISTTSPCVAMESSPNGRVLGVRTENGDIEMYKVEDNGSFTRKNSIRGVS